MKYSQPYYLLPVTLLLNLSHDYEFMSSYVAHNLSISDFSGFCITYEIWKQRPSQLELTKLKNIITKEKSL